MAEDRKIRRLQLLSLMRGVEHRDASMALAQALEREGRAIDLSDRTNRLAIEYGARTDATTAACLRAQRGMAEHLLNLSNQASRGAEAASQAFQQARSVEHNKRRQRDLVDEALQAAHRVGTILD